MLTFAHLPEAVSRCSSADLGSLDDGTLRELIDECEAWQRKTDRFHSQIGSPSTLVIWRALVERDCASVKDICARLRAELARRG